MSTRLLDPKTTASPPSFAPVSTRRLQRQCACGGIPGPDGECAECRKKRLGLQRHAAGRSEPSAVPPIVNEVLRSPGQPLEPETRAFMEPRLGHDFSRVRVHANERAAESAGAVNALAYTVGRDVVFGAGQYAPGTAEGQRLLAHELTHVVQQARAVTLPSAGNLSIQTQDEGPEQEATWVAAAIARGEAIPTAPVRWHAGGISRQISTPAPITSPSDPARTSQVECVKRLGGCPETRSGGFPSPSEIEQYNRYCRDETAYTGPDLTPTPEECQSRPPAPPPAATEITAVDERVEGPWYYPPSYAGWLAAATRIGEVYMTDTNSMVDNVLLALQPGQQMSRLNILDHGNPHGVEIGDDWITIHNVTRYTPTLSRLSGHFAPGAFVHLQHCEAGQNTDLMAALADALGVPVYAGTGKHNPIYRINFGDYVRVDPGGTVHRHVARP